MHLKNHNIFTINNMKTVKGVKLGYLTIILHLIPSTLNSHGIDICPFASDECRKLCLNQSGFARVFPKVQQARLRKTDEFLTDRKVFIVKMLEEIAFYQHKASKLGLKLAVRPNGTSDIFWGKLRVSGKNLFEHFPNVQFYDYTKNPFVLGNSDTIKNYDVTFSYSGNNWELCLSILRRGYNVAVPFAVTKEDKLPVLYEGFQVVDGDKDDLRFLDPKGGSIIGLRGKGKARSTNKHKIESNFLIQIERATK